MPPPVKGNGVEGVREVSRLRLLPDTNEEGADKGEKQKEEREGITNVSVTGNVS